MFCNVKCLQERKVKITSLIQSFNYTSLVLLWNYRSVPGSLLQLDLRRWKYLKKDEDADCIQTAHGRGFRIEE